MEGPGVGNFEELSLRSSSGCESAHFLFGCRFEFVDGSSVASKPSKMSTHLMGDVSSDPEPGKHSDSARNPVSVIGGKKDEAVKIVAGDIVEMDTEDGRHVFVVADIMGFRFKKSRLEYFCRWKGYPIADNTWEPAEEIVNICDAELLKKWNDIAAQATVNKSETPSSEMASKSSSTRLSFNSGKESQQCKKIKTSPILNPSTVNPWLTCRFCQNAYETQNILCNHIADKHAQYREFTGPDAVERIIPPLGDPEQDKVFKCRLCPFRDKEKRLVFQHKYQIHDDILPVPCDQRSCNMRFANSEDLFSHRVEIHFPEPRAPTSTIKQEDISKNIPADSTNTDAYPAAANGRIKCPNKGCPSTFTRIQSAKEHILLRRCRFLPFRSEETPSPKSPTIPSMFKQHQVKSNPINSSESDIGDSQEGPKPKTLFKDTSFKVASASSIPVDEMETITLRRVKGSCLICGALPADLKGHLLNTHIIPLDKVHRFM